MNKMYKSEKLEFYTKDGELHRVDGPALIKYHKSGGKTESWYFYGKLHRYVGTIVIEDGVEYRDLKQGPAVIYYDKEGKITSEQWYQTGNLHRLEGPAVINYEEKGEYWYKNGKYHREDGPAFIEEGRQEWWLNGVLIHKIEK